MLATMEDGMTEKLHKELQLGDTYIWDTTFQQILKALGSSSPQQVFFDMDGVLAAEVVGEGSVAVLVTSFFDCLATKKQLSSFPKPSEAHSLLGKIYSVPLLKECGFCGFLGISFFLSF